MKRTSLVVLICFLFSVKSFSQISEKNCIQMLLNYTKWEPNSLIIHLTSLSDPWVIDSDYFNISGRRVISVYKKPYRITAEFNKATKNIVLTTPTFNLDRFMAYEEMKSLGLENTMTKKKGDGYSIELWDDMRKYKQTSTMIVVTSYADKVEYSATIN